MTLCTLFSVLCTLSLSLYSCTSEDEAPSYAPIELTTPNIELGEVTASATSRAVVGADGAVDWARFYLYMLDSDYKVLGGGSEYGSYSYDKSDDGWQTPDTPPVVQNGAGQYFAGITGTVYFDATETMPAISDARYGYRGYVTVAEDGSFTPGAPLQPLTAAVQVKLKDANGAGITGEAVKLYRCFFDGLYRSAGIWSEKKFPIGSDDAVILSMAYSSLYSLSLVYAGFTPGTYPGKLEALDGVAAGYFKMIPATADPTEPWTLFTIHYCPDGFEWSSDISNYVPKGELFTWAVNYSGTLTLEAGKLYTFTITLGSDRVITLDDDAVSISEWKTGETINIGK